MALPFSSRLLRRALPTALLLVPTATLASTYYTRKHGRRDEENVVNSTRTTTSRHTLLPVSHAEAGAVVTDARASSSGHRAGKFDPTLPNIPASRVRGANGKQEKKESKDGAILVTFGEGVYDISSFVSSHPGGDQILLAAGGPLEPYWNLFPQHASEFVLDTLEELRVGNLTMDDEWIAQHCKKKETSGSDSDVSPYATDPVRDGRLIVQSKAPFTAEPPAELLVGKQHTPNELFYVRNHMPVPVIDGGEYRLRVCDKNGKTVGELTLEDLKDKFEKVSVSATVQCAGNRRNELNRVKKVKGGGWEVGAISNAEWSGARLTDVLTELVGSEEEVSRGRHGLHVCFHGLDADPVSGGTYAASVPVDVLRRHKDGVVLAYEMNGVTLPRDHGYPVRVVVGGVVGARAVKWVGRVEMSEKESESHWQQKDYRSFAPDVDWDTVDFSSAPSIQEMPVVSAICAQRWDGRQGRVRVEGYAWSGDGKGIIRVDVSVDGGKTWTAARLREKPRGKRNEEYDWTLWTAEVEVEGGEAEGGEVEVVCKAVDSAYNSQPDGASSVWNLRGLLNNAWHRVPLLRNDEDLTT